MSSRCQLELTTGIGYCRGNRSRFGMKHHNSICDRFAIHTDGTGSRRKRIARTTIRTSDGDQ
ncbi:hypothetical protein [Blastopirellula marina]|uniref:hypothetical protein n=1 Tax=Blastopirellula marina TaxID=124 RepID=UPI0039658AE3